MDNLPPEILSRIVTFLRGSNDKPQLSSYTTISRAWQAAIERSIFKMVVINLDIVALQQLRKVLTAGDAYRARALTLLSVDLGRITDKVYEEGSQLEQDRWRAAAAYLFTVIKEIADHAGNSPPLHLFFFNDKFQSGDWAALQQHAPKSTPDLHHVNKFEITSTRLLSQCSATKVFATLRNLPNLEDCRIRSEDNFEWGRRLRMTRREGIRSSIDTTDILKNHS
jgi:hypothetical protein